MMVKYPVIRRNGLGNPNVDTLIEWKKCEGCGATHLDDEDCEYGCVRCECCKFMTSLSFLNETLLLEADSEICNECAKAFLNEMNEYRAPSESLSIMGDYKGRV